MTGQDALFSTRELITPRPEQPREFHGVLVRPAASSGGAGPRGAILRIATALVAVGLFTMSWDRLLNLQVAGYYVKVPALVFSVAVVLALLTSRDRRRAVIGAGPKRVVVGLTATIVLYETVRGALSAVPAAAAAQVLALLTGAVLPALALLLVIRTRAQLRWALRCLLAGAGVAAAFGLYQLTAFYLGWPQGISYTGVGIGGGIGRISAFNYEPAYFAYYIVLALGAYIALRRLDGGDVQWRVLVVFAAVLYLANVRAVPLVVLAFALLLLVAFSVNRRLIARGAVIGSVTVAVALVVPLVIASVAAQHAAAVAQQAAAAQGVEGEGRQGVSADSHQADETDSTGRADREDGSGDVAPAPTTNAAAPSRVIRSQLQTVDPSEPSSNGPRLALYRAVLEQIGRAPAFGVGPGNLAVALRRDAPSTVVDQGAGQVVANNIWLQALADGGVPLLLLELALVASVAIAAVKRRRTTVFPLAGAWLAVVLVGGMLTSYFFDIKIWCVLALLLVGFTVTETGRPTERRDVVR